MLPTCQMQCLVLDTHHGARRVRRTPGAPGQLEVRQGGPEDPGTEGSSGALEPDGVGLGRTLKAAVGFSRQTWREGRGVSEQRYQCVQSTEL